MRTVTLAAIGRAAALCIVCSWLLGWHAAAGTIDRQYLLGNDVQENGVPGNPVGVNFGGFILTLDSVGTSGANDLNDLEVAGNPVYADTSARPLAGPGAVGVRLDGSGDYLFGDNLNSPANSRSSIDYVDDFGVPNPGPFNYRGIANRFLQFWVRPDASGLGTSAVQSLVVDSNQHGALLSANDTWVMRYAGVDYDSGVVAGTDWYHVMVARPFGPTGSRSGSRMWVNGVGVAAAAGGYDGAAREELVVGANTAEDVLGNFTGGTEQFFSGIIDDLTLWVVGDNSTNAGPPPGMDYGDFDFATDNEFAASVLTGVPGDLNQDGNLDGADRSAFISGWGARNLVMGVPTGDIQSVAAGDLNFDGLTDIQDLASMQRALTAAGLPRIRGSELVPEPVSTWLVLWGLGCGVVGRRRRRVPPTAAVWH